MPEREQIASYENLLRMNEAEQKQAMKRLAATYTDAALAKEWNVPPAAVTRLRAKLGIKKTNTANARNVSGQQMQVTRRPKYQLHIAGPFLPESLLSLLQSLPQGRSFEMDIEIREQ